MDALLDSGAEISNFDRNVARRLGITDLSTGMPIQVASASQAATSDTGYIHDIDIVVFGRPVTIPIVFCPTWPEGTPNLLGMEGFFDHWVFAIDHSRRRLYYEPAT